MIQESGVMFHSILFIYFIPDILLYINQQDSYY